MNEPIAVIGSGLRLPGGANTPSELWSLLRSPRDLLLPIPPSRFNANGFYHSSDQYHGHSNIKHSYFLSEDSSHRCFDAKFFNVHPAEAAVMDPQIRLLLEVVYEALESGGLPSQSLRGSNTAVYVGLMMGDYERLMLRDEESIGQYHVTGTTRSLVANRISYFFDWHGPSITLDTACSSSLVAVHYAVQQLRSGQSRVAIAAGANLILDPQYYITESKLHMLSPDSRSRMWDINANGYARGEGITAVVLKKLSDAEADGDLIECVIRETGVNQDGRTKGITMPSAEAQARLIRDCYHRAGLDLARAEDRPQYFEAHGTGTPAGDPVEAEAISLAMPPIEDSILHVGSIKTIMGHAEGAAGLAALLKTSLAMENAAIPGNMLLNRLNPKVAVFCQNVEVPTSTKSWPTTAPDSPLRASVNSFGFGGTNAHAILETYRPAPIKQIIRASNEDGMSQAKKDAITFLPFVFSAASEASLVRYLVKFRSWLQDNESSIHLRDLAYTLCAKRSHHPVSVAFTAATARKLCEDIDEKLRIGSMENSTVGHKALSHIRPAPESRKVLGVFTGQGAGWPGMGAALVTKLPVLNEMVQRLEARLSTLPVSDRPAWSLSNELRRFDSLHVNTAALSQPLCTALQILQVELIRAAGISFTAVVGHSSGEIAAAYAAGMITPEEAISIAYQRGVNCSLAQGANGASGKMMAVGASFDDVKALCDEPEMRGRVCVAAVNSPASVTVSGDTDAIHEMETILQDEKKFVRILRVDKAYHSHHMIPCSKPYRASLEALGINAKEGNSCSWYSSVLEGKRMNNSAESLSGQYWELNMAEPVLFMQAIQHACTSEGPFDMAIELGPHPALKGPTLQTVDEVAQVQLSYCGVCSRGEDSFQSFAAALGFIWTRLGAESIDFTRYQEFVGGRTSPALVKGLPTYAWDHDHEHWHESRLTRAVRTRKDPAHELLGHLQPDSTDEEMRWRNILRPQEIEWLSKHRLQGQVVFPAAGYIVIAIEAAMVLSRAAQVTIIEVLDLNIVKALTFDHDDSSVEALFSISGVTSTDHGINARFKYHAGLWDHDGPVQLLAEGNIRIDLGQPLNELLPVRSASPPNLMPVRTEDFYSALEVAEYEYHGPFAALHKIQRKYGAAMGRISILQDTDMLIHPATLDAAFQSVLLAHSFPGDGRLWSMHVPKTIRSVRVNPHLCLRAKKIGGFLDFDTVQNLDSDVLQGDVQLYTSETEHAMVHVEDLLCVPFSRATDQVDSCMFSNTIYGPMSPDAELVAHDGQPTEQEYHLVGLLERSAAFYLRVLDREVPKDHPSRTAGPLTAYYRFASHVSSPDRTQSSRFWTPQWQHDTHETIAALCGPHIDVIDVKLLRAIGEHILSIATGDMQAIEVGMNENMLAQYYQHAIGMSVYTRYLARTVSQIVHVRPHMDILEIGAGTGGATRGILAEIGQSFASYTFTDVSSGFFTTASSAFSKYAHKMSFRVLDISRDPFEQSFLAAGHSYDLIVASMVLHATPLLAQTLKNVRKLLKPGGYLVVLEGYDNHSFRVGAIFGAFPGWWLGKEDGRVLSPCVNQVRWDELLRSSGFSGCDTVTPDPDPLIMPLTLFVSQGVDDKVDFLRKPLSHSSDHCSQLIPGMAKQHLMLLGGGTLKTSQLLNYLKPLVKPFFSNVQHCYFLADVPTNLSPSTIILSTLDLDEPVFSNMTETGWETIKGILTQVRVVLWVTHSLRSNSPYSNMMKGILRCSARELPSLDSQILEVENIKDLDARTLVEYLLRLQASSLWQRKNVSQPITSTIEEELVLDKHDKALTPRLVPSQDMNVRYNSSRRQLRSSCTLDTSIVVRLELTDSIFLLRAEKHPPQHHGAGTTIHITHSILSALKVSVTGYLHLVMGKDCRSGHQVVAVASTNSNSECAWKNACCRVRPNPNGEAKFLELVAQHMTITNVLEGLSQGDTILVYEADVRFAAAMVLQANAVNVDVIFTTRSPAVAATNGWNLIQAYSAERTLRRVIPERVSAFIDLSARDGPGLIGHRIRRQLHHSCRAYDLKTLWSTEVMTPPDSHMDSVLNRLQCAVSYAEHSIQIVDSESSSHYEVSHLQIAAIDGSSKDYPPFTVVIWESGSTIHITEQPIDYRPLFRETGTYWLAGLSGGLGLSLCEWMIRHGARNIVISSRNPDIDERWLSQMTSAGARVKVFSCDITDAEEVIAVHASIRSRLPPIIGVAQGAMVLEDIMLGDMSFDSLSKVLAPKVAGSVHLNDLFQENTLDFFVFFSSVAAVVGNPGQSNYSAANFFMTGLAEQRRQRGLAASIIHIGPVVGVGYIAQEDILAKTVRSQTKGYVGISERDFHQLFAEAVLSSPPDSGLSIEITTGLQLIQPNNNSEVTPGWASNPRLCHFVLNSQLSHRRESAGSGAVVPIKTQLDGAASRPAIYKIISEAFLIKLSALFQLDPKSLDRGDLRDFRLDEAGIDSLLAVEIRTWFIKTLDVNIPVLRILSASAGDLVDLASQTLTESLIPNISEPVAEVEVSVVPSVDQGLIPDSTTPASVSGKHQDEEPVLNDVYSLSYSQKMFWFVETALEDHTSLNHSGAFRVTGHLRTEQLAVAIHMVGKQHEALRTCFFEGDGKGKQGVMASSLLFLEQQHIESAMEVEPVRLAMQNHVYDIRRGETMRVMLLTVSETVHFLVMGANGLVMDGLSFQVFITDLQQHYMSLGKSADVTRQFHEFAQKQNEDYNTGRYDGALKFWRTVYPEFPPPMPILRISTASSRPVLASYENERVDIRIEASMRAQIQAVCRRHRVTAFHFFLSILRTLITRHGGVDAEDVSIGVGDANRTDHDMIGSIGMFLNMLPLRFRTQASTTFAAILTDTRDKMYDALAHSEVPFQVLIDEVEAPRSAHCTPIFQCFIDYRQGQREKTAWADCQLEMLTFQASKTPYDIALDIIDNAEGECFLMFQVRKDLYDHSAVLRLASSYKHLVQVFAANQRLRLSQPDMFFPEDTAELKDIIRGPSFNSTWPETICHRIEDVVEAWPEAAAIISESGSDTTYTLLSKSIQDIAATLRDAGATTASRVATLQEPTAYWVSSALAIMRIGATYVPLDLSMPWNRLSAMVRDCEASILLVDSSTESEAPKLVHPSVRTINVETVATSQRGYTPITATANDIAVILYTSGSTGTPKGIKLRHEGLRNWFEPTPSLYQSGREMVLQQSSSIFDMSLTQIATALCFGGSIYLLPRDLRGDASAIGEIIASKEISYTCATPSEYSSWLRYGSQQLLRGSKWKMAVSAGEAVTKTFLDQFTGLGKQDLRLFNMYGPTEVSIVATAIEVPYSNSHRHEHDIAAGHALPNYSVYVVDEYLHLLPEGVQGEIFVGGAGVSPGYLNNSSLTAEKFVPDIFATEDYKIRGWRTMHRTGDIGRWDPHRGLIVEGRVSGDTQIKLRGLRIDLREVESAIIEESAGAIIEAVVSIRNGRQDSSESDFLVAHVIFDRSGDIAISSRPFFLLELQSRLSLPQYMCPTIILAVDHMPRTSSAKLDRKAIAAWSLPDNVHTDEDVENTRLTELESRLRDVWADIIPRSNLTLFARVIGSTDFFHVGGTSILLVALQSRIKAAFGVKIPLVHMFRYSKLGAMAHRIDTDLVNVLTVKNESLDWGKETAIPPHIAHLIAAPPSGSARGLVTESASALKKRARGGKVVVLTGSTGFLGQALLSALVAESSIEIVHCVAVRNTASRTDAILTGMKEMPKVRIHSGDLTSHRLGLRKETANEIFSEADTVIHNGADVSYLKGYDTLRLANVDSTKELAALCLPYRVALHYISTAGVGTFAAMRHGSEYEFPAASAADSPPPCSFDMKLTGRGDYGHNYLAMTATKWASERFLERIVATTAPVWSVHIHRPSLIVRPQGQRHPSDPITDIAWNLRHYSQLIQAVPIILSGSGGKRSASRLNLVALEQVVQEIIQSLHTQHNIDGKLSPQFLHHLGDVDLLLGDLKWLGSFDQKAIPCVASVADEEDSMNSDAFKELPLEVWISEANNAGMDPAVTALFYSLEMSEDIIFPRYGRS